RLTRPVQNNRSARSSIRIAGWSPLPLALCSPLFYFLYEKNGRRIDGLSLLKKLLRHFPVQQVLVVKAVGLLVCRLKLKQRIFPPGTFDYKGHEPPLRNVNMARAMDWLLSH